MAARGRGGPRKNADGPKSPSRGRAKSPAVRGRRGHARARGPSPRTSEPDAGRAPGAARSRGPAPSPPPPTTGTRSRDEDPGRILQRTLDQLPIRKQQRSDSSKIINDVVQKIQKHMETKSASFKDIQKLTTGSYYENLKIRDPDEFDVMFSVPMTRVDVQPFGLDGAFYTVKMKRHPKGPLDAFLSDDIICASTMLKEFRDEVKKAISAAADVKVEPKKTGCPAVTLQLDRSGTKISLDVVLSLEVRSCWPSFTTDGMQIGNWLGTKVRKEYRQQPFHLVAKYEGSDAWRISFSHVEKQILTNHGNKKTCCEKNKKDCCRKQCLKLLKHLIEQLKATNPDLSKFCSYHAKTTLLHACTRRPTDGEWVYADLSQCFQQLLKDFEHYLKEGVLPNFFIPKQNLLSSVSKKSCQALARLIEEQRNNGFPLGSLSLLPPPSAPLLPPLPLGPAASFSSRCFS
uniref:Cyclic GMP-AMP synthase n=1 Tax=Denticeps clupeoides TaxID=299321 RepID=A0AAY4CIC1_9TELE